MIPCLVSPSHHIWEWSLKRKFTDLKKSGEDGDDDFREVNSAFLLLSLGVALAHSGCAHTTVQ